MALCTSCSAPLPTNAARCSYCGTRNDLDVLAMELFVASEELSALNCPDCHEPMQIIRLCKDGSFAVNSCKVCYGLFFDPGEVQAFLDASVAQAFVINPLQLVNIGRDRIDPQRPVRYRPCPECGKHMNRVNFGTTSGVVVDQCKNHGIWLDNGELIHLMEWKKAGGELRNREREAMRRGLAVKEERAKGSLPEFVLYKPVEEQGEDLLTTALNLLTKLFG